MGQQQRTEVTESLLVRHQHDNNIVYSEENGGARVGDGGSVAGSCVTTILALSTFVGACSIWGLGCAVNWDIHHLLNLQSWKTWDFLWQRQFEIAVGLVEVLLYYPLFKCCAAICGKTTDLLGRKSTMWILNIFYISGWLAIAFTKIMSCWGMSFMYVVGSFVNWRILALIAIIPGIVQLPILFFIPESPRWLEKVGRDKEVEAALLRLRGDKADISNEATDIKEYVETLKSFSQGGILDVFQKEYVRPLLIVFGMMTLSSLGGINAFAYYSGVIFVSAGISSMTGLVTLATTQTLLGLLGTFLIDKSGRRPLLLVSFTGLCISSSLTALSFFLKEYNWWSQGTPILALIGLLMYMGSYVVSSGIPWLLIAELFPINVRGSAGSICNFISSITGWAVAYYFNFLIEWSSAGVFFIFSAFCCANFILAATMVPETKGRTLEEIQASITRSSQ
ncbi:General substrate transporter [Corchorus olitorius]|uniref:General substrate transporter n=1 Tax=Corchorus olitorius TaxID=93759 RepID=A0A1R3JW09_9ROSI|nr:General substrate transporter [Corchorus olitorius]